MKLVLAAGHTPDFPGCSKNGVFEHQTCASITKALLKKLRANRDVDVYEVGGKLHDKVDKINCIDPDCAVEVHLGNTNTNLTGARAFYSDGGNSRQLAESLLDGCEHTLHSESRWSGIGWFKKITPAQVQAGKFSGHICKVDLLLSKTMCDAVIIEPYYISSRDDVERFKNNPDLVASAIYEGLIQYNQRFLEAA
jgi:N-acetylmuramoyl-L-alanine amidase